MSVPTVIDMRAEADEVFEGMYTVSGSMGTDYGNRFVTINKEVYPEALGQEYEVWLKEELDRQQESMDIAEERQNVETKRTFGKIADISGYSGNRIRIEETETSTKNPGESHTKVSEHLLVYISPTVVYRVELQGSADDKAFMAVLDEMMASFTLK